MENQAQSTETSSATKRLVFVLCPFQGHINPMLQLATILNSKGFSITIVHPKLNSPNPLNHPDFTFVSLPPANGSSEGKVGDFVSTLLDPNENSEQPFQEFMEKTMIVEEDHDHDHDHDGREPGHERSVACIVYDGVMHFAQTVADRLKLPAISVRTSAAITLLIFAVIPRPQGDGYMSIQEALSQDLGPKFQSLELKDIVASVTQHIPPQNLQELRALITKATNSSSAIIVNTLNFLEQEVLQNVQQLFSSPIFPIGPFHKLVPKSSTSASTFSLLQEQTDCMFWLNKQAPESVIYVSFGSMVTMEQEQVNEIAWGLANSGQPFLWVVRPGLTRGAEPVLPNGFKESVGERGCVVKWAPQKEVLQHNAIGGFWTHCGWNSTLESICEGVPMICRPFFGDQILNSKYVSRAWKIGLEMKGDLERGKIESDIRRIMCNEAGKEIRLRAKEFKERAGLCLEKGGASCQSLEELVNLISSF